MKGNILVINKKSEPNFQSSEERNGTGRKNSRRSRERDRVPQTKGMNNLDQKKSKRW